MGGKLTGERQRLLFHPENSLKSKHNYPQHIQYSMKNSVSEIFNNEILTQVLYNSCTSTMFVLAVEPEEQFRCISANRKYFEATQLKPEQVIGKRADEILPPEAYLVASAGYKKAIATKNTVVYMEKVDFGFGSDIVETTLTPVLDDSGNCTHLIGSCEKVNKKIETENQIKIMAQTLSSINECVSITDINNVIIYVNEAFLKTYGYENEELIGQHISILKPQNTDQTDIDHITHDTLEGGWKGELINVKKDGSEFPVFVSASPVYNEEGELIALVGVTVDLTQKKLEEKKQKETEKWIESITQNSPDIIYVFSVKENRNIYTNRSIAKMLGYAEGEVDEFSFGFLLTTIHPDDLFQFEEFYKKIKDWEEGFVFSYEYRMKTKNGQWRWFKGNEKEFQRENGKVVSLIGTVQDITDKKMAEKKLIESEERYRLLADTIPDAIALYDPDYRPLYVSPAAERISGYSVEEINNMNIFDLVHPEDYPTFLASINEAKSKGATGSIYQYRYKHKRGHYIWIETTSNLVYENSAVAMIISVSRDITNRKNAESQLLYQSLILDQIQDLVTVTDLEGNITYVNSAEEKMLGLKKEEITGKNVVFYGDDPGDTASQKEIIESTILNGAWQGEKINYDVNGRPIILNVRTSLLRDVSGEIIGLCGVSTDITEYKKAREELRQSNEMFRILFNNMIEGFSLNEIITDENGKPVDWRFLQVNKAHETHSGIRAEEIVGKTIKEIFPDIEQQWIDFYGQVALTGIPGHFEGYNVSTDRYYHVNAFSPAKGKFAGVFSDTTLKKQAELELLNAKEKAEAANRLKTSFLKNISHEFRTPLNGILGFAELLNDPDLTEEQKQDYMPKLKKSSARFLDTIGDIMDISLLSSGTMETHVNTFAVAPLFESLYQKHLNAARQKNLQFICQIPETGKSAAVTSDPELFSKILNHMINNALKFTDSGTISFGFVPKTNQLECYVKDTGKGMSKEFLNEIFKPFQQEDTRDTRGHEGSGLGLSIIKGMVELLGGKINVSSSFNQGTTISFTLPYDKKITQQIPTNPITSKPLPGRQIVILVADDDPDSYKYFETLLKKYAFAVLHAWNGKEAVQLCRANPSVSLVLMDLKMPVMDGLEATRQIKTLYPDLPVIAQTSFALSGDEYLAREAGCDDYLPKPIGIRALIDKLEKFGIPINH